MKFLNNIYMETTDPNSGYNRIIKYDVFVSIFLHIILYTLCLFTIKMFMCKVLNIDILKKINYNNFILGLFIIMFLGYFGRLYRTKSVYESVKEKTKNDSLALEKTRQLINNAYFQWYFLG